MLIKTQDVIFRQELYPRQETSPTTVQKYAEDLSVLPPILVNQHHELIDGWHRWTAHKKAGVEEIEAMMTETTSDTHLLELAIEHNATHGLQLSQSDKRDMARKIYHNTPLPDQGEKKKHLAKILSVSDRAVQGWLSRIDKDNKENRNVAVVQLYLSCHCQEEIAGKVGMTHKGVGRVLEQMEGFRFVPKLGHHSEIKEDNVRMDLIASENCENAEHTTDFAPPIYNIWKQQTKTSGSSHFGNSEVRWLDSLLYLYTQPFDIILDPFAGGGSTIDLCKKRMRRYFVSDRLPIVEREHEIRQHDLIVDGKVALPKPPQWQDVKLVYLDPPYWKQAEGKYSQDPTDLANMDLDDFTRLLAGIITGYAKKLTDAYIALIIQPTQWKAPNRDFVDHIGDMLKVVKLPVDMRYSVPYESQQCTPQMVDWSKDNKRCLVLTREIVVWRV